MTVPVPSIGGDAACHRETVDRLRWRRPVVWAAAALATVVAGFLSFLAAIPAPTLTAPAPNAAALARPTDGVVVLTGGSRRIAEGVRLISLGVAHRLLISGVHEDVRLDDLLSAPIARRLGGRIDLDYRAEDTEANAVETARWVHRHGYRSVRVVTSTYHVPRARLELAAALGDIDIVMHAVAPDRGEPPGLLVREYLKYVLAAARLTAERLGGRLDRRGGGAMSPAILSQAASPDAGGWPETMAE